MVVPIPWPLDRPQFARRGAFRGAVGGSAHRTTLQLSQPLAGASGTATMGAHATLELAAADSASVTFAASTDMLKLDQPSTFSAEISASRATARWPVRIKSISKASTTTRRSSPAPCPAPHLAILLRNNAEQMPRFERIRRLYISTPHHAFFEGDVQHRDSQCRIVSWHVAGCNTRSLL
jgi:hypothetical protein